ncbi:Annexin [Giardia muris]|uniref:Annexin n=1 Tax=Giardia muris TaxID=5742 RepID=A0A4Z1SV46_GIAMU|nr:Annexin [Giardia muris]|eukprot:TNJ29686.1 Annexin [Giardia muris]
MSEVLVSSLCHELHDALSGHAIKGMSVANTLCRQTQEVSSRVALRYQAMTGRSLVSLLTFDSTEEYRQILAQLCLPRLTFRTQVVHQGILAIEEDAGIADSIFLRIIAVLSPLSNAELYDLNLEYRRVFSSCLSTDIDLAISRGSRNNPELSGTRGDAICRIFVSLLSAARDEAVDSYGDISAHIHTLMGSPSAEEATFSLIELLCARSRMSVCRLNDGGLNVLHVLQKLSNDGIIGPVLQTLFLAIYYSSYDQDLFWAYLLSQAISRADTKLLHVTTLLGYDQATDLATSYRTITGGRDLLADLQTTQAESEVVVLGMLLRIIQTE